MKAKDNRDMKKFLTKRNLRNTAASVIILAFFFLMSIILQYVIDAAEFIPAAFVFAVFLVSLITDGYVFGIAASLISMLAMNYAFTFPYFTFNFTIPENVISAMLMLSVTFITGALTAKLKHSEALRAEAEKEKIRANLLRAVSHDLRTPLTTVYGSTTAILENYESIDDQSKKEMLKGIAEDSEWLIRMVENLLSVTRLDGDTVKLALTPTVPEELIDSVLSKFHKRYPSVSVDVTTPDEFVSVSMDAMLIEQVLVNLLENSVQHAKGMTKLSVSIEVKDGSATFSVTDDGSGIDPSELPLIFSGRLHKDGAERRGMGIGLSVCSTIVKAHGSRITAENILPRGSKFSFALPAEIEEISYDEQ